MKIRSLAVGTAALLLPFAAVACGGDDDTNSGSRPSADEISTAISKELPDSLPEGVADCIGKELHDSKIPNGVLRATVEGRDAEVDKDNEDEYTKILTEAGASCASEAVAAE